MKEESVVIATHQSVWVKENLINNVMIAIHLPNLKETNEWTCRIVAEFETTHDHVVYGIDSFQSVKLAFGLVRVLVDKFIAMGWKMADKTDDGSIYELSKEEMAKYISAFF